MRSIALLLVVLATVGCERSAGTAPLPEAVSDVPAEQKKPGEPIIRVRIKPEATELKITAPTRVQVKAVGRDYRQLLSTPLTIKRVGDSWQLSATGVKVPLSRDVLTVEPLGPVNLGLAGRGYPGSLQLVPVASDPDPTVYDRFDVVNHVHLEAYLPGVLDKELYDHWKPAAYLAQAIAARTYALDRMIEQGAGRHYDVESTVASQAYGGETTHSLASRAVADTAGLVLTWRGKVFTTYYSSTCGGIGQNPNDAFGKPGVHPLNPQKAHNWCEHSKHHQWGPIYRRVDTLSRRLAAWGRAVRSPIASLGRIRNIRISHINQLGRPVRYEISDDRGKSYLLRGESLRRALNWSNEDVGVEPPSDRVKSSFLELTVEGNRVRIVGRGFGHGVGLCQYGAEGMARAGYTPERILAAYYPDAKLERAY